jgi:hypothetical protein
MNEARPKPCLCMQRERPGYSARYACQVCLICTLPWRASAVAQNMAVSTLSHAHRYLAPRTRHTRLSIHNSLAKGPRIQELTYHDSLGCSVLAWTHEQGEHKHSRHNHTEADITSTACQAPLPRTVCILTHAQTQTRMANLATVTMLERPRMATELGARASTNASRLLHMLKNDRVAVLYVNHGPLPTAS